MTTLKRIFAKLIQSDRFGQILAQADTDDEDMPCIKIRCDTHPEFLEPTQVTLSFQGGEDAYQKLADITDAQMEGFAQAISRQGDQFTGVEGS